MIEKTVNSNIIYHGKIIKVRRDEVELGDKSASMREVVSNSGGATIIALTDNDEVVLVRQFRYPYKEEIFELPAGKLSEGEDALSAARRELTEETGFTAEKITHLCDIYPTPAYVDEVIHLYLATGLKQGEQKLDEGEYVTVHLLPINKAYDMIKSGEIKDAKTIIGISRVLCDRLTSK